ncbi:MAG TPA: tripartite tricarboxylate transporter substrate binding protein, partial [Burkholderiales bacterium]|nr:tripartite tricarboxylate transporter substrate binding protein [Burkholderiales bacterium]
MKTLPRLALAAAALALVSTSFAQTYPTRPVRMMVPFPAGGGSDTMGRIVGAKLSERLGQQIVVENRPGAAGSIGADIAARAPADGYSILLGSTSELVQYPNVNPKIPYDPLRDFAPVSLVGTIPMVLVVHPSLPVKNVKDLVALAKSRPGEINFGSAGQGATTHLAVELFIQLTGVRMTHVPYKGSPQAVADLVAGNVQLGIPTMPAALPFIKAGRVKVLGVTTGKRASNLPDVPTLNEAGVKGYEAALWTGILAPAGTPAPIINRLNAEIAKVLELKDVQEALARQGAEAQPSSPAEFAA